MNYQDIVNLLRAEATRVQFMMGAADMIEKVGSLDQAIAERESAHAAAVAASESILLQQAGAQANLDATAQEAAALIASAKKDAAKVVKGAVEKAAAITLKAELEAKDAVAMAIQARIVERDQLVLEVESKANDLLNLTGAVHDMETRGATALLDLSVAEDKLASIKAQIAKMLE